MAGIKLFGNRLMTNAQAPMRSCASMEGLHSPACFNSILSSSSVILKLVPLILFKMGLIDGIIPTNLASTTTPTVPITFSPGLLVTFPPLRSSIINKQSPNYSANSIALASPLSKPISKVARLFSFG